MQMVMTERDKKLIVMLSIIVIVVAIGYWGILPSVKATVTAKEEIEKQEEIKRQNDIKLAQIPVFSERVERNNEKIAELKKDFFPMMNSDQIDKMFTGMILERGLFAFDLNIRIDKTPLNAGPYAYSAMALDPYYRLDTEDESEDELMELSPDSSDDELFDDGQSNVNDHVYRAHVVFRIGGGKTELLDLVDNLEADDRLLLITGYRWSVSNYVEPYDPTHSVDEGITEEDLPEGAHIEEDAQGTYMVFVREVLELEMDIYMYDDSIDANTEE